MMFDDVVQNSEKGRTSAFSISKTPDFKYKSLIEIGMQTLHQQAAWFDV